MNLKVGVIGCGNMGEAFIRGACLCKSKTQLIISDTNKKKLNILKNKYKVKVAQDNTEVIKKSKIIIIAVKPQEIDNVLNEIKTVFRKVSSKDRRDFLIISIVAGISTKYIEKISAGLKVVRVMPNLPALINEGISGMAKGKHVTAKELTLAKDIVKSLGDAEVVKEKYIDLVTALSGSGPAYFFYFMNELVKAGRKLGMDEKLCRKLILQTASGSVKIAKNSKNSLDELVKKVASKGGTTEAALEQFNIGKLNRVVNKAVGAAFKRAKQLNKSL